LLQRAGGRAAVGIVEIPVVALLCSQHDAVPAGVAIGTGKSVGSVGRVTGIAVVDATIGAAVSGHCVGVITGLVGRYIQAAVATERTARSAVAVRTTQPTGFGCAAVAPATVAVRGIAVITGFVAADLTVATFFTGSSGLWTTEVGVDLRAAVDAAAPVQWSGIADFRALDRSVSAVVALDAPRVRAGPTAVEHTSGATVSGDSVTVVALLTQFSQAIATGVAGAARLAREYLTGPIGLHVTVCVATVTGRLVAIITCF
jgi:hypothetical protein